MLDMGFLPQVKSIVQQLPAERHTMFFSATLDGQIGQLAAHFTRDAERLAHRREPERHRRAAVGPPVADLPRLQPGQPHRRAARADPRRGRPRAGLLPHPPRRRPARRAPRAPGPRRRPRCTATSASRSASAPCAASPAAHARVLVATDVAARGIDLDDIGTGRQLRPARGSTTPTRTASGAPPAPAAPAAPSRMVMPEHAEQIGRMAVKLGLHEPWGESRLRARAAARVLRAAPPRAGRAAEPPLAPAPGRDGPAPAAGAPAPARANRVAARLPDTRRVI